MTCLRECITIKILKSLLFGVIVLGLAACSDDSESRESEKAFDLVGSTYEGNNGVFEFLEVEQMDSAITDDQIIAITMNYTNTTDESQDPWFAFDLTGTQETENTIEILEGANGLFPDDYNPEAVEMGGSYIKPGSTVEAVIGYTLHTLGEPVHFKPLFTDGDFHAIVETTAVD